MNTRKKVQFEVVFFSIYTFTVLYIPHASIHQLPRSNISAEYLNTLLGFSFLFVQRIRLFFDNIQEIIKVKIVALAEVSSYLQDIECTKTLQTTPVRLLLYY